MLPTIIHYHTSSSSSDDTHCSTTARITAAAAVAAAATAAAGLAAFCGAGAGTATAAGLAAAGVAAVLGGSALMGVGGVSPTWESIDATRHLLLMMCQPFHTVTCYEVRGHADFVLRFAHTLNAMCVRVVVPMLVQLSLRTPCCCTSSAAVALPLLPLVLCHMLRHCLLQLQLYTLSSEEQADPRLYAARHCFKALDCVPCANT